MNISSNWRCHSFPLSYEALSLHLLASFLVDTLFPAAAALFALRFVHYSHVLYCYYNLSHHFIKYLYLIKWFVVIFTLNYFISNLNYFLPVLIHLNSFHCCLKVTESSQKATKKFTKTKFIRPIVAKFIINVFIIVTKMTFPLN